MSESSDYLYRIMPFEHVIDLFEKRELYFANPSAWDDPYERVLKHNRTTYLFAQCWGKRAMSDAMWRIYSPKHTSLRIRTSREKLSYVGKRIQAQLDCTFTLQDVRYEKPKIVKSELDNIASTLSKKFNAEIATQAMFIKRDAFDYEAEVRSLIYLKSNHQAVKQGFLRAPVDPHHLVESILFDPRADAAFVKMASYYLKNALMFTGNIARSNLYSAHEVEIIEAVDAVDAVDADSSTLDLNYSTDSCITT